MSKYIYLVIAVMVLIIETCQLVSVASATSFVMNHYSPFFISPYLRERRPFFMSWVQMWMVNM